MNADLPPAYFVLPQETALSSTQATVLGAIRGALEEMRPAGVDPDETSATIERDALRVAVPHIADHSARVEVVVDRSGEIGVYCTPLGEDFYIKFNDPYEPWESAGGTTDAVELVRALLEGRVEAHRTIVRGRIIRSRFFVTEAVGDRRSLGVYYHVGRMPWALLARARSDIRRPDFREARSPY